MRPGFPLRKALSGLLLSALLLPMGICLTIGVARLLSAMGDVAGARVLDRLALAGGMLWTLTLISMVIVQGALLLDEPRGRHDEMPRDELEEE